MQLLNILVGRTTSERFGFKAQNNSSTEEEQGPVMVGSTISSDHAPVFVLKVKPWYANLADMLFLNSSEPEYGSTKCH